LAHQKAIESAVEAEELRNRPRCQRLKIIGTKLHPEQLSSPEKRQGGRETSEPSQSAPKSRKRNSPGEGTLTFSPSPATATASNARTKSTTSRGVSCVPKKTSLAELPRVETERSPASQKLSQTPTSTPATQATSMAPCTPCGARSSCPTIEGRSTYQQPPQDTTGTPATLARFTELVTPSVAQSTATAPATSLEGYTAFHLPPLTETMATQAYDDPVWQWEMGRRAAAAARAAARANRRFNKAH
jgi:hypothetical protein